MEHEVDGETNCKWCVWDNPQKIGTGTEGVGDRRTSGDYPDNSIVAVSQNTEKGPGNLRKLELKLQ